MIIPDINLLIYIHDSSNRNHSIVKRIVKQWWLEKINRSEQIGLPWVVVLGFVRILSNPRIVEKPRQPALLLEIMSEILNLPCVQIAAPGMRHIRIMNALFEESGGTGKLTTDIHLAALAIELGACLASNDADFTRFKTLKLINPLS